MPSVHVRQKTDRPAEAVLEAAKDFSERRADMTIHDIGPTYADVTEGNPWPIMSVVWERLRYDWSSGDAVHGTVIDSSIFKPGSTWGIWARPTTSGSIVEVKATRRLRGRGWLLAPFFPTGLAKRDVQDYLTNFLDRLRHEQREKATP